MKINATKNITQQQENEQWHKIIIIIALITTILLDKMHVQAMEKVKRILLATVNGMKKYTSHMEANITRMLVSLGIIK